MLVGAPPTYNVLTEPEEAALLWAPVPEICSNVEFDDIKITDRERDAALRLQRAECIDTAVANGH